MDAIYDIGHLRRRHERGMRQLERGLKEQAKDLGRQRAALDQRLALVRRAVTPPELKALRGESVLAQALKMLVL